MKHIAQHTQALIKQLSLPTSRRGMGLSVLAGVTGLVLLVGHTYADIDVQTAMSNNVMTLKQLFTTDTGLPTGTRKATISHTGVKLNITPANGVLQRDGNNYITQMLVSGSDIGDNTITNTNITNNTIQTYNIATNAVTNNAVSTNTITCDKLNIPGFTCSAAGQVCPVNQVLQGTNGSGTVQCTGATAGTGGLTPCGAGQSYVWTGSPASWQCVSILIGDPYNGSLWAIATGTNNIYNKNYATGNVGIHITTPAARLHDSGTFLVNGSGILNISGATPPAQYTTASGTIYTYFDTYSIQTSDPLYTSYAQTLPLCNCKYDGTGAVGSPTQPCNQYQMHTDYPYATYNYWNPLLTGTDVRFAFGNLLARGGATRITWNDGYYNNQQDVGDRCRREYTDPYMPGAYIRRKYAQCTFPYSIGSPPPSAPAGGYRYSARIGVSLFSGSSQPNFNSYVAGCATGGAPAYIPRTGNQTFTTGTYLGKVACSYKLITGAYQNNSVYMQWYLDIPATGYAALNPASCTYSASSGTIYTLSGSAGSSSGAISNFYGVSCGPDIASLASYSGNHVLFVTGGKVGILTDSPQYTLDVVGTVRAAAVMITSDMRKKDHITRISHALQKLLGIHGYMYEMIADGSHHYGVLAQEVEKIFPAIVTTDEYGTKAVRYNSLIGVLIESIRDIDTIIQGNKKLLEENEVMLHQLENNMH